MQRPYQPISRGYTRLEGEMIQHPVGMLLTAAVAASSGAVTGWLAALFVDWLGILIGLTE